MLEGFVACTGSPYVQCVDITCAEHNRKLKFSMATHLTDVKFIHVFVYCHAIVF